MFSRTFRRGVKPFAFSSHTGGGILLPISSRGYSLSLHQSTPQASKSQDHGEAPSLFPSTAVNYRLWQEPVNEPKQTFSVRYKTKSSKQNMASSNVTIPGLTLLNNLASHPIASTTDGALINSNPLTTSPLQNLPTQPSKSKKPKFVPAHKRRIEQARIASTHPLNKYEPTTISSKGRIKNNLILSNKPKQNIPAAPQNSTSTFAQDPRVAPSQESGGIPNPSPLYLAQALAPPSAFSDPRRILVIMDLNGTLLYRPNKRNPFNFVERPHARVFLNYCIETFQVAIWSSARPENVDKMVAQLLSPDQRAKCVVTWARDKFGLSPSDYDSRVQCYKRLTTIWSDPKVIASHPASARGQRWDQTNTVLVDDSMEKGRSEPHNILQIPEFAGLNSEPTYVLPQVHDYLNSLCYQADISRFMRQSPFQLNPNYQP